MARNMQPIAKRCKALGISPAVMGYAKKETNRNPGGQMRKKKSEYGIQLNEKQKVKFIYGILEKQFHSYYEAAAAAPGKTGDNLLLIPAADREKKLQRELPYIYRARITRKIPGTVNIDITAAKAVCCIQGGTEWYVVGAGGKVLETGQSPKEGLMQVIGVSPKPGKTGEPLELENEAAAEVTDGHGAPLSFMYLFKQAHHLNIGYRIAVLVQDQIQRHKIPGNPDVDWKSDRNKN